MFQLSHSISLSLSLFVTLPPSCLEIPLPHDIILICRVAATQVTPATATAILRMMKLCLGGLTALPREPLGFCGAGSCRFFSGQDLI